MFCKEYKDVYISKLGKREAVLVTGAKGTGKTTSIYNFVDFDLRHLLFDVMGGADAEGKASVFSIGQSNKCKRIEKYNISSAKILKDRFDVCMKFKSSAEFRYVLKDILAESFCSTVLKFRTGEAEDCEVSGYFLERFNRAFKDSIFYNLFDCDADMFLNRGDLNLKAMDMMYIYSLTKNKMHKNNKNNEDDIRSIIKEEIFLKDDLTVSKLKGVLNFRIDKILDELSSRLDIYLDKTLGNYFISKDGYYVREFTKEGLAKDAKLWRKIIKGEEFFVFIDEVVFNLPLNENVERIIREKGNSRLVNRHGNITLTMYDYSYDDDATDDKMYKFLEDFIYARNVNSILLFRDINAGTENKDGVLSKFVRNLNKCIDLFIVNNKLDIHIDNIRVREGRDKEDILMLNSLNSFDSPINDDIAKDIIEKVKEFKNVGVESCNKFQSAKKKQLDVHVVVMFSTYNIKPEAIFIKEYEPMNFVKLLVDRLTNPKIKSLNIEVKCLESDISIDLPKVKEVLEEVLKTKESRKLFLAIKQNITENLGIDISSEVFDEIQQRIKIGETIVYSGKKGSAVGGVNIQFPSNFKNLITEELVRKIAESSINFGSTKENKETKEIFIRELANLRSFISRDVVKEVLYSELTEIIIENSTERENNILDKYLMKIYSDFVNLEKVGVDNNFKEKLVKTLGETILGYFRCIYREEGYTK